ncbi:MAG: hypothetical protein Q8P54_00315 [bacterium]|nr:hypothetical protein [bacterium]
MANKFRIYYYNQNLTFKAGLWLQFKGLALTTGGEKYNGKKNI